MGCEDVLICIIKVALEWNGVFGCELEYPSANMCLIIV